jgi:hypothetical protein
LVFNKVANFGPKICENRRNFDHDIEACFCAKILQLSTAHHFGSDLRFSEKNKQNYFGSDSRFSVHKLSLSRKILGR